MGPLEGVLGGSGSLRGPLGRVLGASWGDLGASWEGLGASWSGLLGACWHKVISYYFWIDFGPIWRPKWVPKGAQHGRQSASTASTKIYMKYEGRQVPRGSVLSPSWVVLGSILRSQIIKFRWFYKGSVNIVFLKKIRLGSASWTDLGSILTPKGVPKGSQIGPQMEPTWHRKTFETSDRVLIDLNTSYPGTALEKLSEPEPWRG